MVDVTDEEELTAWLDKQPHQAKVAIANRAAMRVLPLVLGKLDSVPTENNDYRLSCFRSNLISGVASTRLTSELGNELTLAARSARAARITRTTLVKLDAARVTTLAALDATLSIRAKSATRATLNATTAGTADLPFPTGIPLEDIRVPNKSELDRTYASLEKDIGFISASPDPRILYQQPLWHDRSPPQSISFRWLTFRDSNTATEWAFWIEWYQDMLDGRPMDWDLQRKIALLPDEDWEKGATHIARRVAEIRNAVSDSSAEILDLIPDQDEHFRFGWSENDRLSILPDNELVNEGLFVALSEMLLAPDGPLETLTTHYQHNNNTPQAALIGPSIEGYAKELAKERSKINFALLYFHGNGVISAASNAKREQESGEWPEPDAPIATAIDQVCTTHGPMIMATKAGLDIVEAGTTYNATTKQNRENGANLYEVVQTAATDYDLVEPETEQTIHALTRPDEGDQHPGRTGGLLIRMINSTLVTFVGGAVVGASGVTAIIAMTSSTVSTSVLAVGAAVGTSLLWESFKGSIPGKSTIGAGTEKIDALWKASTNGNQGTETTVQQNVQEIEKSLRLPEYRRMAELVRKNENKFRHLANMMPEFNWVHRAIDWIKQQQNRKDD